MGVQSAGKRAIGFAAISGNRPAGQIVRRMWAYAKAAAR